MGTPASVVDQGTAEVERDTGEDGQGIAGERIAVAGKVAAASIGRAIVAPAAFLAVASLVEALAFPADNREVAASVVALRLVDPAPIARWSLLEAASGLVEPIRVRLHPRHLGDVVRFAQALRRVR